MLHNEFEVLIGRKATNEEYEFANAIYNTIPCEWDKDTFCKAYKDAKLNDSAKGLINALITVLCHAERRNHTLEEDCKTHVKSRQDLTRDFGEWCADLACGDTETSARKMAHRLLGESEYIKYKISMGYELDSDDLAFISTRL